MLKLALWDFGFSDVWGGYVGHLGGLVTSLRLQLDSRVRLVERLASSRSGVLRPAKHNEEQRQTIGGSKYGVKSVEPFPTNIIKSISYVQLKRNIWCTRYMELLSKTGTALWIGKWGICPPCVPAPPPRFPLDHCSRHLRWVKAVRHRSAEHPGGDHCDDGSGREE